MSPADSDKPPDSTRRFRPGQFSLRTMMVCIAVFSIWLGWYVHSATRQQRAVRAILERGGTVTYDYQYDTAQDRVVPNGKAPRPVWLQRLLGDDYFHHVVRVSLDDVATDADLVHLEVMPRLRQLFLGGADVSDAGLEHLENLRELRLLVLWGNPISGRGLKHLRGLKELRQLDLSQTPSQDEHLIHLTHLSRLERLDLPNNPQISGSFLEHIADLPNLQSLVLRGSGISDEYLVHLKRTKKLQSLMLDGTQVTDAAVIHLQDLTSLQNLDVTDTGVSRAAVAVIKASLPQASIKP
ncbi:MAG: hypothetical protein WD847_12020 [Pirellulales bacterium]